MQKYHSVTRKIQNTSVHSRNRSHTVLCIMYPPGVFQDAGLSIHKNQILHHHSGMIETMCFFFLSFRCLSVVRAMSIEITFFISHYLQEMINFECCRLFVLCGKNRQEIVKEKAKAQKYFVGLFSNCEKPIKMRRQQSNKD